MMRKIKYWSEIEKKHIFLFFSSEFLTASLKLFFLFLLEIICGLSLLFTQEYGDTIAISGCVLKSGGGNYFISFSLKLFLDCPCCLLKNMGTQLLYLGAF